MCITSELRARSACASSGLMNVSITPPPIVLNVIASRRAASAGRPAVVGRKLELRSAS